MEKKSTRIILVLLLLTGLLASLLLCGIRSGMELKNTRVSVVMTEEAAAKLSGLPEGVSLFDGAPVQGDTLILVEDENQYSYVPEEETDARLQAVPVTEKGGASCVRCFRLTEKFASRYNYLGYSGAEEIENILYRAVTDRNILLLWLEPFMDGETGEAVTDATVYSELIESLSARLARQGLTLGNEYSVFPPYAPNTLLLILTAFGAAAGAVLLLGRGFGLKDKFCLILLVLSCVGCAGLLLLMQDMGITLIAFAASVIYPCLAITWTELRLEKAENHGIGRELGFCASTLVIGFLIVLTGGLTVAALQSSTEWLLAIRNFRGVKLSAAIPLLYAVYIVLRRLCTPKEILQGKKYLLLLAVLVLAAAAVIFLLRTGDGSLAVTALEQRLRNLLEKLLLVRPRSKEFLVAWPCLGFACGLCARGAKRWAWPFAILTAPGFSSVVNTFCHSRSPVWLSALRGVYGMLFGLAAALVLSALLHKKQTD